MRPSSIRPALLLLVAVALAFTLRIHGLDRLGLETDEGLYSFIASLPLTKLPAYLAGNESTPPLYLFLLKGWQLLFRSDAGLRLLSVLIGTASVPMSFLLGRRLLGTSAGLAAAYLLAAAPMHVRFSQTAKNPVLFFFLFQCALLVTLDREPRRRSWVVLTLALAGMLYTHGLAPVFIAGLGLVFLVHAGSDRAARLRPWGLSHVVAAALFVPWLGIALSQVSGTLDHFWAPMPGVMEPLRTLANFTLLRPEPSVLRFSEPEPEDPIDPDEMPSPGLGEKILERAWFAPAGLAMILGIAFLALERRWRALSIIGLLFAFPVGSVWLVSQLTASVYIDRALLPALIAVPLILSSPFLTPRRPEGAPEPLPARGGERASRLPQWGRAAVALSFASTLFCSWHLSANRPGEEWREAVSTIAERAQPGDAVVFDAHFGEVLFDRYATPPAADLPRYGLPSRVADLDIPDWRLRVRDEADLGPLIAASSSHPGLWLVLSHTELHDPGGLAAAWAEAHLVRAEAHKFVGVVLVRYLCPASRAEEARFGYIPSPRGRPFHTWTQNQGRLLQVCKHR